MPVDAEVDTVRGRSWKRHLRLRPGFLLLVAGCFLFLRFWMVSMPGTSFSGPLPAAPELAASRGVLRQHVNRLANRIGERQLYAVENLDLARGYIEERLAGYGYAPRAQLFTVEGIEVANLEVEKRGTVASEQIVIVGAHYDTTRGQPGANDNASGTAVLLELARAFADVSTERTLRFVAFVNEEPPWFQSEKMGSYVYAGGCHEREEDVVAMWSLECLGYFSDEDGSQDYPIGLLSLFYPSRGNFVAFVANSRSRGLLHESLGTFRQRIAFPSEGACLPALLPGVGWSDHWSFWQFGYPAVMITDTALFRDPNYHHPDDTPERLDYDAMARVTEGLRATLTEIVRADPTFPRR